MRVLAIETSTSQGSVAIVDLDRDASNGKRVLWQKTFSSERSHNALMFGPLGEALAGVPHGSLDMVLVGLGPGSYTGIRIGIAAAHGIATALGIPWRGWTSLAAVDDAPYFHVFGDARRGTYFHAVLKAGSLASSPSLHENSTLAAAMENIRGPVFTTDAKPLHPLMTSRRPEAARLAVFAPLAMEERNPPEPIYLRAPYITIPKQAMASACGSA